MDVKTKYQAHGSPGNLIDLYASADIPECETFGSMPYNIDGFRYAFIGQSDSQLFIGAIILIILNFCLFFLCYLMFEKGYKLKS